VTLTAISVTYLYGSAARSIRPLVSI